MSSSLVQPSYQNGYARNASESAYPNMWRGLIGAWVPALGPTGTTLRDISPFKRDATLAFLDTGPEPAYIIGGYDKLPGYVLSFDASDTYGTIPDNDAFDLATEGSAIVVFRHVLDFNISNEGLVAKYVGQGENSRSWLINVVVASGVINVALSSTGSFQGLNDLDSTSTVGATDKVWHHVGFTYKGSDETRLFFDGVNEATDTTPPTSLHISTKPVTIGWQFFDVGDTNDNDTVLGGDIAYVLLYDRALTPAEMLLDFQIPLAPLILRPRALRGI